MLRYKCMVLAHADTVVQTEKAIGYPYFKEYIERVRPGHSLTYPEYVADCNNMIFADMCRRKWQFTDEELLEEYMGWKAYSLQHMPPIFPGIDRIIHRQKEEGGLVCVASMSGTENILRDYNAHFGMVPDAIFSWDLPEHQRKPSPYALHQIMQTYNLTRDELLMIDDMRPGVDMARAAGVKVAFAAWGRLDHPEIMAPMEQICEYTFRNTQELEKFLFREESL